MSKSIIVTGAGTGIGESIARRADDAGYKVGVLDINNEAAEAVASSLTNGVALHASTTDPGQIEQALEMFGETPDALVNNAGITQDNLFMRMKPEQWLQVIDVNLNGVFHVTKSVIRTMVKQHSGRIINISSVVGFSGNPGQVNYSSTKSGLIGFTKSLSREVGTRGITVNAVAPGFINTAMTQALNESQQQAILSQIPLGRMGEVDDIANAVAFLASEEASYITGTVLHVNGGMY